MQRLFVPLEREALLKLIELAQWERRSPQEQAAVMIERQLREQGAQPGPRRSGRTSEAATR